MNGIRNRTARLPKAPFEIPARVAARALEKFVIDETSGCHISTYSVSSSGYAQIGWNEPNDRHVVSAHRAAWVKEHGQIPAGMTLDHTCKEKRCVRVSHLRMLDNYENGRRTRGQDWPLGQCKNGHPNSELHLRGNGARTPKMECRICRKEWDRRYRANQRAKQLGLAA